MGGLFSWEDGEMKAQVKIAVALCMALSESISDEVAVSDFSFYIPEESSAT